MKETSNMRIAGSPYPASVDEIMATLRHSSLPTLIVEGGDDVIVYREIENRLSHMGISVFPAHGRPNVLELFRRRNELSATLKLAFVADRDTWVHTGIPREYSQNCLIFTHGYSIENDVYVDGRLWKLLGKKERFCHELAEILDWYALALSRHLSDQTLSISDHVNAILDCSHEKKEERLRLTEGEAWPHALRTLLWKKYFFLLRGKTLMALLIRNLKGQKIPYNDKALLHSVSIRPGKFLKKISSDVERCFETMGVER
ncbi:DUF4435 domain-containing protein [Desulfobotulus mexicanus]|nr:DUF4435 domain-containing protein [Desulfobotulus mexicanus]